ncbi:MAG: chemotaxis protein, partial [Azorhizobium sp. 32-67-21]
MTALDRSLAVIEFTPGGEILHANENFLKVIGYSLNEIKGKRHRMFIDPEQAASTDYQGFWKRLAKGEFYAGEFLRIGKGHRQVWLEATYNPVIDPSGHVVRIIKLAADVTERKLRAADAQGQIAAISQSQAVIHFDMDGTILEANENFLSAMGYRLEEIQGRHHSMFVAPEEEVWIQATYTPILDASGKPFKVVKFATDVTEAVRLRMQRQAIQTEIAAELDRITTQLEQATHEASSASSAASQTAGNVQSVAAASEELAASVEEIRRQVYDSTELAQTAARESVRTNDIVTGLANAAQKIGDVVALI